MKLLKTLLLASSLMPLCLLAHPTAPFDPPAPLDQTEVILDAGSSGTRLHVYHVTDNGVEEVIPPIKSHNSLSQYIDDHSHSENGVNTQEIDNLITNLVNQAQQQLPDITNDPIYVYGTAGLRLSRQEAAETAMHEVSNVLHQLGFANPVASVVSGQTEALFDWVGINEASLLSAAPCGPHPHTEGALDMGGASFEVAYEAVPGTYVDPTLSQHVVIHGVPHTVYTESYLGLGENHMITAVDDDYLNSRSVCYPEGVWGHETAPGTQGFDYWSCQYNLSNYLDAHHVVPVDPNQHYQAFSGFAYTDNFFDHASLQHLPNHVQAHCQAPWHDFVAGSDEPHRYLQDYCMEGVYTDLLLEQQLHLDDQHVQFDTQDVDWTTGAALLLAEHDIDPTTGLPIPNPMQHSKMKRK